MMCGRRPTGVEQALGHQSRTKGPAEASFFGFFQPTRRVGRSRPDFSRLFGRLCSAYRDLRTRLHHRANTQNSLFSGRSEGPVQPLVWRRLCWTMAGL